MPLRERVQKAVSASTTRAETVLAEATHADEHERLTILIDGWFRGIAAALEEIALELDMRAAPTGEAAGAGSTPRREAAPSTSDDSEQVAETDRSDDADLETLRERARESTKETQALRAERDSEHDDEADS